MADIDDAWDTVQAKLKQFAEAIEEFRTIKVRTMVADFEVVERDAADGSKRFFDIQIDNADGANKPKGLVTRIDMLEGDILHGRSPGLDPTEEARLREIHAQHVELGQRIFSDNIRFIADTIERFRRKPA